MDIDPDEAVQILLEGEEEALFSNNVEDFVDIKLYAYEALARERGGIYGSHKAPRLPIDDICEIVARSPHAAKSYEPNRVDLSNATEVTLSDGRKIPINQNRPKK